MRSFVCGNGKSRSNINLEELRSYGLIYGCNALYRDFTPDYLIAVDVKMVVEIESKGYHLNNPVWTNQNSKFKKFKNLNYFEPSLGWSSGPTALNMASNHGATEIYILGFDYIGSPRGYVNNIYADTENYKKSNEQATYYGNWKRQTYEILKKYPKVNYYRVVDENFYNPDFDVLNFENITIENFRKNITTWKKIR